MRFFRAAMRPLGSVPLLLPVLLASGCEGGERAETPPDTPPSVVASVFPVADLAATLGGEDVRVSTLLPPGASPVTFEVTPEAMRRLGDARVVLLVGGGLDAWAEGLAAGGEARVIRLLDRLELDGSGESPGTGNPHVWLDPVRTRDQLVPRIARALSDAVPAAADRIDERATMLADSLTALDREVQGVLESLEHRSFVASHPAWHYFARRYGLEQVGVAHEHPGREPSAREVARLLERARSAGVRAVFREPQISDASARTLAEELGVPLLVLDPLGGPSVQGRDSYTGLIRYNAAQFLRGLGGRSTGRGP